MKSIENLFMTKQFYTVLVPGFLTTIIISQLLKSSKLALPNMFFTYKSYYLITIYNYVSYIATRFYRYLQFPAGFYLPESIYKVMEHSIFKHNFNSINSEILLPGDQPIHNRLPVPKKCLLN
jgi:hypothetical protein